MMWQLYIPCYYASPNISMHMRNLVISEQIKAKLRDRHTVTRNEVEQCFANKCGTYLEDTREDHQSDPPTLWFVAPTNRGRLLKVIFIYRNGKVFLRSAFEADQKAIRIYDQYGK